MIYLIVALIVLTFVAMLAGWLHNRNLQKQLERGEITELPSIKDVEDMEVLMRNMQAMRGKLLC